MYCTNMMEIRRDMLVSARRMQLKYNLEVHFCFLSRKFMAWVAKIKAEKAPPRQEKDAYHDDKRLFVMVRITGVEPA